MTTPVTQKTDHSAHDLEGGVSPRSPQHPREGQPPPRTRVSVAIALGAIGILALVGVVAFVKSYNPSPAVVVQVAYPSSQVEQPKSGPPATTTMASPAVIPTGAPIVDEADLNRDGRLSSPATTTVDEADLNHDGRLSSDDAGTQVKTGTTGLRSGPLNSRNEANTSEVRTVSQSGSNGGGLHAKCTYSDDCESNCCGTYRFGDLKMRIGCVAKTGPDQQCGAPRPTTTTTTTTTPAPDRGGCWTTFNPATGEDNAHGGHGGTCWTDGGEGSCCTPNDGKTQPRGSTWQPTEMWMCFGRKASYCQDVGKKTGEDCKHDSECATGECSFMGIGVSHQCTPAKKDIRWGSCESLCVLRSTACGMSQEDQGGPDSCIEDVANSYECTHWDEDCHGFHE